jgi:ABC-2 type transport system ATP-binding protein
MTDAAVEFESVTLAFGAPAGRLRALDDLTVEIPAGVVAGIVGPDGAGKTTLMRLAAGLLAPSSGRVTVLGRASAPSSARRGRVPSRPALRLRADQEIGPYTAGEVGYLPQRLGLLGHLTARENLEYFAALNGVATPQARRRMAELLALTGLAPFERRATQNLSGGMKQKLALACAVLHSPRLVLLDEPTTGLDPLFRRDTWEMIFGLLSDGGSVVVATPSWEEAARCQWLLVLHGGRALTAGEPAQLIASAQGLVWELSAPAGGAPPAGAEWVLSVGRRGDAVRVVVAPEVRDQAERLLQELAPGSQPRPAAPGLEDAVAVLLRERSQRRV